MPAWTRTTITPGDRVTVEIQHSDRLMLRPLIGKLRTVAVTDSRRAIIYEENGSRYQFHGRTIPPVDLAEASIFINNATGEMWAHVYHLPPRDPSPFPLPTRYEQVAEPDTRGGIARMLDCWCGRGCVCDTCGEPLVNMPCRRGLEWCSVPVRDSGTHDHQWWHRSSCPPGKHTGPLVLPDCCAIPMMLAPLAWICRRESAHRRPYLWSNQPADHEQHPPQPQETAR